MQNEKLSQDRTPIEPALLGGPAKKKNPPIWTTFNDQISYK